MATLLSKYILLPFFAVISVCGFAQSGFYLTYSCKEGDAGILKIDRTRKGLCATSQPIVTVADVHSVSQPIELGTDFFFDIHLTERGFLKLEQVYDLTKVIVFKVDDQPVFLMDTEKNRLAGTIRVYIGGRRDVAQIHAALARELELSRGR